jgi:hypothetical protein
MLLTCIVEVPGSNLVRDNDYTYLFFHGLPQSLQADLLYNAPRDRRL